MSRVTAPCPIADCRAEIPIRTDLPEGEYCCLCSQKPNLRLWWQKLNGLGMVGVRPMLEAL